MLYFNLRPIFKARGIENPFSYLVNHGITYHTAHRVLNSHNRNFPLDVVERICEILICEPNDLLAYIPWEDHPIADTHPLNNLRESETGDDDLHSSTKDLSYKELKELSKIVKNEISKSNVTKTNPTR